MGRVCRVRAADPFSCLLINALTLTDAKVAVGLHQHAQVQVDKARSPGADAPEDPSFCGDDVDLAVSGPDAIAPLHPYELSRMVNTVPRTFRVALYLTSAPASPSSLLLAKRP